MSNLQSKIIQLRNLQLEAKEILISEIKVEALKLIASNDDIKGFTYNQGVFYFTNSNDRIVDCQTADEYHNIFRLIRSFGNEIYLETTTFKV